MNNPITEKSVQFLAQPYTIAALLLYAVNEFTLQRHFPSVISGKLSGFAWLFIAPVILTLLFSLIFRTKQSNPAAHLSYSLIALFFIGIKTVPIFHDFILLSWKFIFHFPAAIVMDNTDLIALLALPISWLLLQNRMPREKYYHLHTAIVISSFTLLTLADAPAPDMGIFNLSSQQNQIIAQASYGDIYFSEDGGRSWTDCAITSKCASSTIDYQYEQIINIPETDIQYRINDNRIIETSYDNGINWESIYAGKVFSDVNEYYQLQTHQNAASMNSGAQDVIYDPISGNVLFAMGLQGILIIEPTGEIIQAGIGNYQPADLNDPGVVFNILSPFLLLASAVIAISYACIIIFSRKTSYMILSTLTLLAWGYLVYIFPEMFSGYAIVIGFPILLLVLALIIWIFYFVLKEFKTIEILSNHQKWGYFLLAIPGGIAFFLCYALWYLNIIPHLEMATYISFAVVLLWFIYCVFLSFRLKKNQQF